VRASFFIKRLIFIFNSWPPKKNIYDQEAATFFGEEQSLEHKTYDGSSFLDYKKLPKHQYVL
jgi:hypothetical protein